MMIKQSISVRDLVAFHFYSEDISSKNAIQSMNDGAQGHRARQANLKDPYESEVFIKSIFIGENYEIQIQGRMDIFCGSFSIPYIEELKLSNSKNLLEKPIAAHLHQLYIYAGMLFFNDENIQEAEIALCYIDIEGNILKEFKEQISRQAGLDLLWGLLNPYIQHCIDEEAHAQKRNESIADVKFPFAQFRSGQREMAVQVYTAIKQKKKLYASLPTGTGKTIATLFPAIKAMKEGLSNKILYLTARTAARQSPLNAVKMLVDQGLAIRALVITAKEKACINSVVDCNPEACRFAKGHFVREKTAIEDIKQYSLWSFALVREIATKHSICPFEFSLSLYYLADIVICDYNYVFDPFVMLIRANDEASQNTILIDEAHHLISRLRESLSAELSTKVLKEQRLAIKNSIDSKCALYKGISLLIKALQELENDEEHSVIEDIPEDIAYICETIKYYCVDFFAEDNAKLKQELMPVVLELYKSMARFLYAYSNKKHGYKAIVESYASRQSLCLYCIDPRFRILECVHDMAGSVYFSATLTPLPQMKLLLGGNEQDAIFALPSPFPKENILVCNKSISTYYTDRAATALEIAETICEVIQSKTGNYIAYFPSYEYLDLVREEIELLYNGELLVQGRNLNDEEKEDFIQSFVEKNNLLGLCVLGGSFSEGIDLPGKQLIGVFVVGVGLSVPDFKTDLLKEYFEEKYGNGYAYAYQYPAMHRVLQACGRVIRSETDRGIIILFDKRYAWFGYRNLLPEHWDIQKQNILKKVKEFYQ